MYHESLNLIIAFVCWLGLLQLRIQPPICIHSGPFMYLHVTAAWATVDNPHRRSSACVDGHYSSVCMIQVALHKCTCDKVGNSTRKHMAICWRCWLYCHTSPITAVLDVSWRGPRSASTVLPNLLELYVILCLVANSGKGSGFIHHRSLVKAHKKNVTAAWVSSLSKVT